MTEPRLTPDLTSAGPAVDALAARLGGRVPLGDLLDDLPRRGRRTLAPGRAVHRAWTFDAADRRDPRWWPQGITTSGDASPDGVVAGRRVVAVSWYAKKQPDDVDGNQGSRITFLDPETARYRHVLLVGATTGTDGAASLEPLRVHAGGIVWCGPHLHVAATGKGFATVRVADLLRVPDDDADLRARALGYRYVLPVAGWHRGGVDEAAGDDPDDRLRHSYLSLDRAASELVVGEYASNASGASRRLTRFAVDLDTGLPVPDADGVVRPRWVGEGVGHMQGAVVGRGRWHVTTSHGRWTPGSVWTGEPGALRRHRWAAPPGPEDVSFWPARDELWSVTEHPHARWVYSMKRRWFDDAG